MTLRAYWWDPRRPLRALVSEAVNHPTAWATLLAASPHRLQNFGDALNPLVIAELTGHQVKWSPLGSEDLISVGSILNVYARSGGNGSIVGAGVRDPDDPALDRIDRSKVLAVRGELTRDALGLGPETVLGDPGLLIGGMVDKPRSRVDRPVVVPHFADYGVKKTRKLLDLASSAGYDVVPPTLEPLAMARRIASADHVVASSLHALVFADALGVPAQQVSFDDAEKSEPQFKYADYLSVFSLVPHRIAWADLVRVGGPSASARDEMDARQHAVKLRLDVIVEGLHTAARVLA